MTPSEEKLEKQRVVIHPVVCLGRDMCYGVNRACELGYKVSPYPGIIQREIPGEPAMPVGLRRTAVKLLRDTPLRDGGPYHIYAESDFYPHIHMDDYLQLIKDAPQDWDVIQLFADMFYEPVAQNERIRDLSHVTWKKIDADNHWGTHAMVFRGAGVVRTVAALWQRENQPIDEALYYSDLKVYRPSVNLFTQYGINKYRDRELPRDRRFLVGMMSYRRIKDACRQIYSFMDQTYKNFIMYVSLKGIAEEEWKYRLEPNFRHFIKEGRLIVSIDPNDNQINNLVQIYNNIRPEFYDLLIKIDDDDWYDRDYMLRLNQVHSSFGVEVGSQKNIINGGFSQYQGFPTFWGTEIPVWGGSTVVYTKRVARVLSDYAASGFAESYLTPLLGKEIAEQDWTWREDNLLHRLLADIGCIDRNFLDKGAPGLMVNTADFSVTRGITRSQPFYNGRYTHMLSVQTSKGIHRFLVVANRCLEMEESLKRRVGQVVQKKKGEYLVMWDDKKIMTSLVHRRNGIWEEVGE